MVENEEILTTEEDQPQEGKKGILDENGHLRHRLLSTGTLVVRFVQESNGDVTMVSTWVPDNPGEELLQDRITVESGTDPDAGKKEYVACLLQHAGEGIRAIWRCAPELLK